MNSINKRWHLAHICEKKSNNEENSKRLKKHCMHICKTWLTLADPNYVNVSAQCT